MATPVDPNDPLELARRELAKLKDADDWDEPTDRHEINVTVHVPQPSQSEINLEAKDTDPPKSDDKANAITKNVGTLAKLLPPEHRVYFLGLVVLVGGLLLALAKGWI